MPFGMNTQDQYRKSREYLVGKYHRGQPSQLSGQKLPAEDVHKSWYPGGAPGGEIDAPSAQRDGGGSALPCIIGALMVIIPIIVVLLNLC